MSAIALTSPVSASIDHLRSDQASALTQIVGISLFALFAALGAQVYIYLWEIPITLQTVALYGSGLFLGMRNGALAMLLYLVLGLFLPIFAEGSSGAAVLFGANTGGYLLAFPLVAAVTGALSARWNGGLGIVLSLLAGSVVLFSLGVTWFYLINEQVTLLEAIDKGWFRLAIWDFLKVLVVAGTYAGVRRLTAEG